MEPTREDDSFEEYKKYLEDSIGVAGIKAPPKLMTPYQRFYYERKYE